MKRPRPKRPDSEAPDTFLEEVQEEIRRDRLYGYLRKYGWIAVLVVLIAVGTTAYFEYREVADRQDAEERGNRIYEALEIEDASERIDALQSIVAEGGPSRSIVALRTAAELVNDDRIDSAVALLDELAGDDSVDPIYRDLAALKSVMLKADTLEPATRLAELDRLARPGGPFRPLAMEQRAVYYLERGERQMALDELSALLDEPEVSFGLRLRATQGIAALGGNEADEDT